MRVEFYSYEDGEDETKAGEIVLEDDQLTATGAAANNALQFAIRDPVTEGPITARDNPKRFLELLHEEYCSPYLWATMPIE